MAVKWYFKYFSNCSHLGHYFYWGKDVINAYLSRLPCRTDYCNNVTLNFCSQLNLRIEMVIIEYFIGNNSRKMSSKWQKWNWTSFTSTLSLHVEFIQNTNGIINISSSIQSMRDCYYLFQLITPCTNNNTNGYLEAPIEFPIILGTFIEYIYHYVLMT